jgi:cell division protein FtsZ
MGLLDADADSLKYEIQEEVQRGARIKVIGVGGGGTNAVDRLIQEGMAGVEFYAINTDAQALASSRVPNKLQIGSRITKGLGAGSDPAVGRKAALEETEPLLEALAGADMVFVTAGLGGGTGAGAAPVVASVAKQLDALTIAVVTKPFSFEGARRMRQADQSLAELGGTVDTLIAIPNDRLLSIVPKGTSIAEAFKLSDDILRQAVQGISDIITTPGLMNLDFSDIKSIMLGSGYAMMGTAICRGENAATSAAKQAINCPLLDETKIRGSRRILINVTGSAQLGLHEVHEACSLIREAAASEDVQINFGVILNESMADAVKVTVIATGFQPEGMPVPLRAAPMVESRPRPRMPEPVLPVEPVMPVMMEEPVPEPQPEIEAEAAMGPEPVYDPDDLDTPAYLRQGRMIN